MTGGRVAGHGRTSDGALEVDLRTPAEMVGQVGGPTPSSSSLSATRPVSRVPLAAVARRQKLKVGDVEIDSKVMLTTGEERSFTIAVELAVTLPSVEGESAAELVRAAHRVCPYSDATQGQHGGDADRQRRSGRSLEAAAASSGLRGRSGAAPRSWPGRPFRYASAGRSRREDRRGCRIAARRSPCRHGGNWRRR